MSGERNPTWKIVQNFARACDGEPNDLVDLWNAVNGHRGNADASGKLAQLSFQGALRGLHLADGRPAAKTLAIRTASSQHEVTTVESLLGSYPAHRPEGLSWTTTAALITLLKGNPDRVRHHWEALRGGTTLRTTLLTQAFG
ncbi:hypothetical protein V6574_13680 [Streptomyces sp. SM1P]